MQPTNDTDVKTMYSEIFGNFRLRGHKRPLRRSFDRQASKQQRNKNTNSRYTSHVYVLIRVSHNFESSLLHTVTLHAPTFYPPNWSSCIISYSNSFLRCITRLKYTQRYNGSVIASTLVTSLKTNPNVGRASA